MSYNVGYYSFSQKRAEDALVSKEGEKLLKELVDVHSKESLTWEDTIKINEKIVAGKIGEETANLYKKVRARFMGTTLDYEWESLSEVEEFLTDEEKVERQRLAEERQLIKQEQTETILKAKPRKRIDTNSFLVEFAQMYLELGSVEVDEIGAVFYDDLWLEPYCLEALCTAFDLDLNSFAKQSLFIIYKGLTKKKLFAAASLVASNSSIPINEAHGALLSYLAQVRPLVQDLLHTEDAIFYISYGGSVDGHPKSVEDLIFKKAKEYMEELVAKNFSFCK